MDESPVVPPVSDAAMAMYDLELRLLLTTALANNKRYTDQFGHILDDGYRLAMEKRHFRAFRRPTHTSKHDDFLVVGVVTTKLDDIGYALYADTSQASRTINSFLYGNEFVGGGILHTHAIKSPADPYRFFGIKHSIYQLLAPSLFKRREAVYLESMGSTTVDGLPALYTIRRSVDLPQYIGARGCVRMDIQFVNVFMALPSGHVRYFINMTINPHGNFPAWMSNQRSAKLYHVTCIACAFHISKPGHLLRASQAPSTVTASSSAPTSKQRPPTTPSSHAALSVMVAPHVKEDYCKKCFHKARNPQAFKPPDAALAGEFADLVPPSDGQLFRPTTPTGDAPSGDKLLPLEESAIEFNPDLFESLQYQRKLLADMQALLLLSSSTKSSPRHATPSSSSHVA
ncbi:hypothetical protein DYB30_002339 [Aphanomyces astaci]|uniref:START domain-containing protein n=1 Tax=Aphanomyces astaci TaxID=112090 RepID=A0A397DGB5_APHAT|nr:hypothetical protein DYB30_002339 [Aphanomyces astaci]RHY85650.1 hypothetical protein DYB26_001321 [Aphanomyces astaci]